jgi:hypothetical protein
MMGRRGKALKEERRTTAQFENPGILEVLVNSKSIFCRGEVRQEALVMRNDALS